MKNIIIGIGFILTCSCSKENKFDGPNFLADGFESIETVDDLVSETGEWRYYQGTEFENNHEIETEIVHGGLQALKFLAQKTEDGNTSKSDIANNKLAFHEGKTFYGSAWFFIEDTLSLQSLFLFDLEESVQIGAGPGMRLALYEDAGYLVVERGKMLEPTLFQKDEKVPFPRNEWVHLEVKFELSRKKKGSIKVWQNDQLLISEEGVQTMPRDESLIIQGTKGIYNSIQIGITANSDANDCVIYIDDVFCEERD